MALRERRLRRQCRLLLRELDIQPPLDVRVLTQRLAATRGRKIQLLEYPLPVPGPFGMWYGLSDRDVIWYQQGTAAWHQEHIILHELGHLLAGHPSDAEVDDEMTAEIAANPPAGIDPRELGGGASRRRRTCYDDQREREAELTATTIQEWASVLRRNRVYGHGEGEEEQISRSLTHHQGWQ